MAYHRRVPIYVFRCTECRREQDVFRNVTESMDPHRCPRDGAEMKRRFLAPAVIQPVMAGFDAHWNPAVGRVVSTPGEFRSELSRAADAASERLGFAHDYQPVDPRDAPGVDRQEAADQQREKDLNTGRAEPKVIIA